MDKQSQSLFDKTATAVSELCQAAGQVTGSRSAMAHCATGAIVGGVQIMAAAIGHADKRKDDNAGSVVNNDTILLCLLACAAAMDVSYLGDGRLAVETSITPESYAKAMEWFQKVTGRDAYPHLNPALVADVKEHAAKASQGAAMADQLLTQLMGARPINQKPL